MPQSQEYQSLDIEIPHEIPVDEEYEKLVENRDSCGVSVAPDPGASTAWRVVTVSCIGCIVLLLIGSVAWAAFSIHSHSAAANPAADPSPSSYQEPHSRAGMTGPSSHTAQWPKLTDPETWPAFDNGTPGDTSVQQHVPCFGTPLQCEVVHKLPQLDVDFRNMSRVLRSKAGMVAADNSRCSEIGADVLSDGGNAVDAAIATTLCQGVVSPVSSGLGGGHFMTIRLPNGSAEFINAREFAPAAASTNMYDGKGRYAYLEGGLSVAVPTELPGLITAWHRHGSLPWARLVTPAAQLARTGFAAHPYLVYVMRGPFMRGFIMNNTALRETFMLRKAGGGWRLPAVGELCCRRPVLADTLERIADQGLQAVYNEQVAAQLAAEIQSAGGVVTAQDILGAQPEVQQPLLLDVGRYTLITPPPPSSAAVVAFVLRFLHDYGSNGSANAGKEALGYHRLLEGAKHGFALRMWLGDPGTDDRPQANVSAVLQDLVSGEFVQQLRSETRDDGVEDLTRYGGKWNPLVHQITVPMDHGTSHLCVVDANGTAVSLTATINTVFGSGVVSESTGIVLNNEMGDFSIPGQPNNYNLHPAEPNFIQPYKRPLSSMSPIIVVDKDTGKLKMVAGASGGPLIISATLQTLARVLIYNMSAVDAVNRPRVHNQFLPNSTYYEDYSWGKLRVELGEDVLVGLEGRGQVMEQEKYGLGVSQAIVAEGDEFVGVCDPRKDGAPAAPRRGVDV